MHPSTFVLATAMLFSTPLQAVTTSEVQVTIQGVNPGKGPVIVSVYRDGETWLKKGKAVAVKTLESTGKNVVATLTLEPGSYALQAFQDENSNDKLDMNWLPPGPGEPWVVSNNAQGSMGPPSFKDAMFSTEAHQKISLVLQQP